ncbi:VWA domain-containing protein [Cytobacillus solani]|uniref:vWA domain-containing protein n=1 Tax=Cytobacillus solani TaxID=1637975 RepID=UPI0006ABB438|nr:VWA domain-containing protein [Cytobacillus solani]USK55921.1 VWA domain-containing protein [Cytobacillus solani]
MKVRNFNFLLFILTAIGGVIGAFTGEALLSEYKGELPNSILVGLYFGQLGLWIGLLAFIAEKLNPRLNGLRWASSYASFSLKLLVPVMVILPFIAGCLFQFIYELDALDTKSPEDIILIVDISESMLETDPENKTIAAVKEFLMKVDGNQRSALLVFNDQTKMLQSFTFLKNNNEKKQAGDEFESSIRFQGGTDIGLALSDAMEYLNRVNDDRLTMAVLLSDGFSEMNVSRSVKPYQDKQIVINTVGLSQKQNEGADLLSDISERTGGAYYSVDDASKLSSAFQDIQKDTQDRLLIGERQGSAQYMLLYKFLRILFISLIGGGLGLALGMMFDNRFLAQSFAIGGLTAGIIAGLILEWGFGSLFLKGFYIRLWSDIILAVIVSLFSAVVPYRMYNAENGTNRTNVSLYNRKTFAESDKKNTSKTFY